MTANRSRSLGDSRSQGHARSHHRPVEFQKAGLYLELWDGEWNGDWKA